MKFEVFSELYYEVNGPTTFIFNIQVMQSESQVILTEKLITEPAFNLQEFITAEGRFVKLSIEEKVNFKICYSATVDVQHKIIREHELLKKVSLSGADASVITYLYPSRYCQSDKLEKLALKEFGHHTHDYNKVTAVNDWIYNNVEYLGGYTTSSTSAQDTLTERVGVCRDFAHLGIALCRALSIPARYFTAYAFKLFPQDFHACFEAFIGGDWILFDPTKLVPINGLVKIANGRDATDASVASIFGNAMCTALNVNCRAIEDNFEDYKVVNAEVQQALSYQ